MAKTQAEMERLLEWQQIFVEMIEETTTKHMRDGDSPLTIAAAMGIAIGLFAKLNDDHRSCGHERFLNQFSEAMDYALSLPSSHAH